MFRYILYELPFGVLFSVMMTLALILISGIAYFIFSGL